MKLIKSFNPLVMFVYFLFIIILLAFSLNPLIVCPAFIFGIVFLLFDGKSLKKKIKFILINIIVILIFAFTNPLFSHRGITVLFFINDNPVTLESVLYGFFAGMMISDMIIWLKICADVIDTDRLLYILALFAPKMAFVISVVLKMLPMFIKKSEKIFNSRKLLGFCDSRLLLFKEKILSFGTVIVGLPEYIMDLAVIMQSRGYGIKKRASYKIIKFTLRDAVFLCFVILFILLICITMFNLKPFEFFPKIDYKLDTAFCILLTAYLILPTVLELWEMIKWHYLKSKI